MNNKRILLIEDNEDFAEAIENIIKSFGYSVKTSYSSEEGIRLIDESIGLIFSDVDVPICDSGFDVLQYIQKHYRTTPLILMTGGSDFEYIKKRGLENGAYDVIEKPFGGEYIKGTIDKILNV